MDQPLVDRLSTLGRALGNPLRIRVAAEFIARGESSPIEVAGALGEPLGSVSYHVRVLEDLGCLELRRVIPIRGALQHVYGVDASLRSSFPATARAVSQPLGPLGVGSHADVTLDQLVSLERGRSPGAFDPHRRRIAKLGWALSHDLRIRILDQLLTQGEASARSVAGALGEPRGLVGRHFRHLAALQMIKSSRSVPRRGAQEQRWTLGPETKKALRGLGDYLTLVGTDDGPAQVNDNGVSA